MLAAIYFHASSVQIPGWAVILLLLPGLLFLFGIVIYAGFFRGRK